MAELYRYATFISYSSKDAPFAKRLHRALEAYRIPRSLGSFDLINGGKKNRIYPVFRDREELAAGHLGEAIEANLRASASLIVVCSPHAATSPWVEKEIEYFSRLGRRDRIFAVVADSALLVDETGADATALSFPPSFRGDALNGDSLEPLAADARKGKDSFRAAWLKLVAGLIGINAGALADRDRKMRRLRRIQWAASTATIVAALAIAGASVDARSARADLTARAVDLTNQQHPLDAVAFALAGLQTPSDVLSATREDALAALERTGAAVAIDRDFGRMPFFHSFSGDDHFLVAYDENQAGKLYDLRVPTGPPRIFGPLASAHFSNDGRFLLTVSADRVGTLLDLRDAGAPARLVGSLHQYVDFSLSHEGRFLITIAASRDGTLRDLRALSSPPVSLGPLRGFADFASSVDGRFLVTVRPDNVGVLVDRASAVVPRRLLGPLYVFAFSNDGRFLLTVAPDFAGALYDMTTPSAAPLSLGPVLDAGFSNDSRLLFTKGRGEYAVLRHLRERAQELPLGRLAQYHSFAFSSDSRFLLTNASDSAGMLRDLRAPSVPPRALGLVHDFAFSSDVSFLVTKAPNDVGALRNLRDLVSAPLSLGPLSNYSFLGGGHFLVTEGKGHVGTLRDLRGNTVAARALGPLSRYDFSEDGRLLLTMSPDQNGALHDLRRPWSALSASAICRDSGGTIRPFSRAVRDDRSDLLYRRIEGRPWNPCDWRGLLALFPNARAGDGWFEGPRQWWRLITVRHFDGRDWTCDEATSAASAEIRARRREMCALSTRITRAPVPMELAN